MKTEVTRFLTRESFDALVTLRGMRKDSQTMKALHMVFVEGVPPLVVSEQEKVLSFPSLRLAIKAMNEAISRCEVVLAGVYELISTPDWDTDYAVED